MADKFDPYREALVLEIETVWPPACCDWPAEKLDDLERRLHSAPADAAKIEYERLHTGFCRRIVVTESDLDRIAIQ